MECQGKEVEEALKNVLHSNIKISDELRQYGRDFDMKMYAIQKERFPKHMGELVKNYNPNCLSSGAFIPYLFEEMLERGMLKPLTNAQKKTVLSVVAYEK